MSTVPRLAGPGAQPFNNPRVVPQTWYPLALSGELSR